MTKSNEKKTTVAAKEGAPGMLKSSYFTAERKVSFVLLALLLYVIATIRAKFSGIPFERDEGIYSYIGQLILDGKIPYKDFYEQKFPGIFYFYGVMVSLFGYSVEGLHFGFLVLNLLTILFLYFAADKLFSPIAAIITATTFGFVSITPNLSGFAIQAEHGVAFFTSLGIFFYAMFSKTNKWYYPFLMGIAMGFAFMTKTSGVFLVLWGGFALIIANIIGKKFVLKSFVAEVGLYSIGGIIVILFFFALMAAKGSFKDMIFWAYEVPKDYVGKIKFEDGVKYFGYTRDAILQNHKFFWVHGFLAIAVCLLKSVSLRNKIIFISLLAFSCFTIVPGYYFYGHYWIQIIPGLSIMAGLCYKGIIDFITTNLKFNKPQLKYVYLAIFAMLTFKHVMALKSYYFHPNYNMILRAVYGSNPFPESKEIANYIKAHSEPQDQTVLIGSEPQIYVYLNKKCPSRHAYFAALVADFPQHKAWQKEFIGDVETTKPRYLVFFNHAISLFVQPKADRYIFDWANKYITENYHIVGAADMVDGLETAYYWKEALNGFQPKGQNVIYVYERNTPQNAAMPAAAQSTVVTQTK